MLNEVLPNHRHEMFAQLLFNGELAPEAFIEAGYKPNSNNAYRMKCSEAVKSRLSQLANQARIKAGISVSVLCYELDDAINLALTQKQPAAAISGIMGKAKLHGLLTDKVEFTRSSLTDLLAEIDGETRGITNQPIINITPDKTESE